MMMGLHDIGDTYGQLAAPSNGNHLWSTMVWNGENGRKGGLGTRCRTHAPVERPL